MIHRHRSTVAYFCLSLTIIGILPHSVRADDASVAAVLLKDAGKTRAGFQKLDLEPFLKPGTLTFNAAGWSAQASSGWSSYSTAKKTWIIVGIVAGVAVVAVVLSNRGDNNGGSGGGGY